MNNKKLLTCDSQNERQKINKNFNLLFMKNIHGNDIIDRCNKDAEFSK